MDAGTVWVDDVDAARLRLASLKEFGVLWLEEPFVGGALDAYGSLSNEALPVKLAGGEGAFNFHMAKQLIDHGGLGYIQIDTGRIGGIGTAKQVVDYASTKGVTFVNHTFTTHLALSASLQPFAGIESAEICEYPVEASELATSLTLSRIEVSADGFVWVPDRPGLGIEPDLEVMKKYLVDVEIKIGGEVLYLTPEV